MLKNTIFVLIKESFEKEEIKKVFQKEAYVEGEHFIQEKYNAYLEKIKQNKTKIALKGKKQ